MHVHVELVQDNCVPPYLFLANLLACSILVVVRHLSLVSHVLVLSVYVILNLTLWHVLPINMSCMYMLVLNVYMFCLT